MKITTTKELINAMMQEVVNEAPVIVYSLSQHGKYAQQIINELVKEHPTWKNTLMALSVYPIQKWAYDNRLLLNLNINEMDKDIGDYFLGIFGNINMIERQKISLDSSKAVIDIIENMFLDKNTNTLTAQTIRGVHSNKIDDIYDFVKDDDADCTIKKEKMSKYDLCKHYRNALTTVCRKYSREINKIIKSIETSSPTEEEIKIVYHDADYLLKVCRKMKSSFNRRYYNVDSDNLCSIIDSCIACIETYPFKGKDIALIMNNTINGVSVKDTTRKLEKSTQYLYDRYNDGIAALSMLLWGYSSSQIIGLLNMNI